MTNDEIRERLLDLARVRLKSRFGAFEQFRLTLEGLPAGAVILARAGLMPAPWTVGLKMGLDEAAKQIDIHFLRLIDAWAQEQAPARQISTLEGLQHLPAESSSETAQPKVTTHSPAPVLAETTEQRRARWLDWYGKGERGAVQRVHERERELNPKADRSFIGKQIEIAKSERAKVTRAGGGWASQLVQDGKRKG